MGKGEIKETDDAGTEICGRWKHWEDAHCENPPGMGTGHEGYAACFECGGRGSGPPEGSANAMKTGARMHPSRYYEVQEMPQQVYIVDIYQTYMADAPFGYENVALSSEVWLLAIDRHKRMRMNDVLSEEGIIVSEENIAPDGSVYYKDKENPVLLAYHRIQRDTMDALKKLGIIDNIGETKTASDGQMSVEVSIHGVEGADSTTVDAETE